MSDQQSKPVLVMFAGPNGSGKSTVTRLFQRQPNFPQKYINPDEIALTLGGNTMSKAYEASAIAAQERIECIENRESFSFETVMSHPSKLAILESAKKAGFETQVVFISTDNPSTNVERVKKRVQDGGHNVPENKVVSRYYRSLSLLPKTLEIADRTYIFDNSSRASKLKAILSQGQVIEKSGDKIKWVENTIATLDERQQEKSAIEQSNLNSLMAPLDQGEYTGKIKSVGEHFVVQQNTDGQTIVHEKSILDFERSAIGHNVLISYRDGVHNIDIPELSINRSQTIEDIVFDLASSAKYIATNEGTQKTDKLDQKTYSFPSGIEIEKSQSNLSVSYKDKSIEFDRDFTVIKNELGELEIRQISQLVQEIKQQSLEQSPTQQIDLDIDRS